MFSNIVKEFSLTTLITLSKTMFPLRKFELSFKK